jgi:hypothetical protein
MIFNSSRSTKVLWTCEIPQWFLSKKMEYGNICTEEDSLLPDLREVVPPAPESTTDLKKLRSRLEDAKNMSNSKDAKF